ncbi:MAG: serine protein kinase RIO [Halobacteriota archaeon]
MPKRTDERIKRFERAVDALRILNREADDFKVTEEVFDEPTLKALYTLSSNGTVKALGGSISTGKEANVFHALGPDDTELAIKIYRIKTSDFKAMQDYIIGDHRFAHVRRTKKDVVFAWTKKEYRNLLRACKAQVRVPEPIKYRQNVLVMEFMGKDGVAFPLLKHAAANVQNPESVYKTTICFMKKLYQKAHLVHADLSEYNILIDSEERPIFIDMGQSVLLDHPRASMFLKRDVKNVIKFFRAAGVQASEAEALYEITS